MKTTFIGLNGKIENVNLNKNRVHTVRVLIALNVRQLTAHYHLKIKL